ncbi:hypothetical protein EGI16_06735 [Chryseobacterium sp. G0240]|uniref:DUF6265 family protein n=1 Tax=Chryseobacterium sp. G0240 TaxID=2487066 RepID=UPI000F458861|nr:DUF6265 family protein [Chryseobacterium sp. G0240]ROI05015.1 hypothetical protein EGI16_06735 [Chryseobacterium sp. G0240]
MKSIFKITAIILIALSFTMCNTKQNEKAENFDWLLGKWQRTKKEQGKTTIEYWEKTNNLEYNGVGFTTQNNDTISQEQMKIIKNDGKWNLLVKTLEEKEFIRFEMSDIETDKFEFKNDTLDFPKLIKYWKNGDKINASVSGDSLKLSFEFERIK